MERRVRNVTTTHAQIDSYALHLGKLGKLVSENGFEGIILVPGPNLRYFTSVNSLLLERPFLFFVPKEGQPHLVAPTLESGPYLRAPVPIVVHNWDDGVGPGKAIEETVRQLGIRGKWGLEGKVPYQYLSQLLKYAQPLLENAEPALQKIREVKDAQEIKLLQRAASILSKSFLKIPEMLKSGISELDLARQISQEIAINGAESAQDVLVQSGAMAADGHHLPSNKKIRRKESIVVDASCTFSGYFADITRTFVIGSDRTFESLYQNVLYAQTAAIRASQQGVTVGSIDHAARGYLQQNGLDKYFVHRTGHGLGLEVHEAPYIIPEGTEVLQASMVFTVEPGVYMRDKTGLRIEDDILVTEGGRKVLSKSVPNEFEWWR
jgi:Xaa-Pro dipeptidase